METLVSGQAALYAVKTPDGYTIMRLDEEPVNCAPKELRYFFAGCNDVRSVSFRSHQEAQLATKRAWAADRALLLFLFLIDPADGLDDVEELVTTLAELLEDQRVRRDVENRLYAHELPTQIQFSRITELIRQSDLVSKIFLEFSNHQASIVRVRQSYDAIPDDLFDEFERDTLLQEAIDRGLIYDLVRAAETEKGIESVLFDLYLKLKSYPNSRRIINEWTSSFKRTPKISFNWDELREAPAYLEGNGRTQVDRKAYERVMAQQQSIIEKIQKGDLDSARKFAADLIQSQSRESEPEHLAKSLSKLSKAARDLQAFELSLEWAQLSTTVKPDDPWSYGHLAEALVHFGRYTEALNSIEQIEAFGDEAFAATLRARILRLQNKPTDALEAYKSALEKYKGTPEEPYAWAGVAESLRDLTRFEEALQVYSTAKAAFPDEPGIWCGYAATLVDMGRLEEALHEYQQVDNLHGGVVPKNGIASVLTAFGQLGAAEEIYREVIEAYPFDLISRNGLASLLREQGRIEEGVQLARTIVADFPESAEGLRTLGDNLLADRRFEEASSVFKEGADKFPYNGYFLAALARVERDRGNYEASLAALERAKTYFPNNSRIEVSRAAMFRRLGRVEEALAIYRKVLGQNPHARFAQNAYASILIYKGEFDEAFGLLDCDNPTSKHEWRTFLLRSILDLRTGRLEDARARAKWALEHVPFHRERKMFAATLASLEIRAGRPNDAALVSTECAGDVTTLFRFHALASNGQSLDARGLYEILKEQFVPEPYVEMREEIASVYGISDRRQTHNKQWIYEQETKLLLLEAA
ncbi:tetratricopeptide repeat protein [Sphingomonas flavescens]|uniref:tetratricopeptide repeat protein n=1 Tax=Sphingomonas flavescens TaxID=3132797 RepID=UPI002804F9AE|nr:tetratricopeptide repeat protein [Sphingomonas limnosediminicola]